MTAMQELTEYLKNHSLIDKRFLIKKCEKLIEKEKRQIIEACIEFGMHNDETNRERGENYYNLIYKKQ